MSSPLDLLKALLEGVPSGFVDLWSPVKEGQDKVIKELTQEEISEYEELHSLESDLRSSLKESLRLIQLFESKRFLFKDKLRLSEERAESADRRGCVLDVRKDPDGVPVLVETKLSLFE